MTTFPYRGELTRHELLPALAAGAVIGGTVAYVAQLILRKRTLGSAEATPAGPRPENA